MTLFAEVINALWFILPAYVANSSPTLLAGVKTMDSGKNFIDGKRILGDGKTWEGFFGGIAIGSLIGFLLIMFYDVVAEFAIHYQIVLTQTNMSIVFALCVGALVGDVVGSFIKRRFSIERGEPAPLLDQLDFVIGSLFFASFFTVLELRTIVILIFLTPVIHWLSCVIGYIFRIKRRPW